MRTVNQQLDLSLLKLLVDPREVEMLLGTYGKKLYNDIQEKEEWTQLDTKSMAFLDWYVIQKRNRDNFDEVYEYITGEELNNNKGEDR